MKRSLKFFDFIPELILFAECVIYWIYSSPFNPLAFLLLALILAEFIYRNRGLTLGVAILFLILNFYMCLALVSKLNKTFVFIQEAQSFLLAAGIMFLTGMAAGLAMLLRNGNDLSNYRNIRISSE